MSLLNNLAAPFRKRVKSAADWIGLMVTPPDTIDRHTSINVDQAALVARLNEWVFRACSQNARSVCAHPLRMYRPASNAAGRKAHGPGRKLSRKRAEWVRRPGRLGPGAKSVMYAELAGEVEEVIDHPALALLRHGNDYMSGGDVLNLTIMFRESAGNGYWHIAVERGEPVGLWPLMPQHTFIIADERDFIRSYQSGRQGQLIHEFQPEEIIHFKHQPSPLEPFYGISWLRAAVYAADIYEASSIHERSVWKNGARPDYAVMLKGTGYTPQQAEQTQRRLVAKHGGPHKSGQPIVIGANDIEIKPLGFSPREMEYVLGRGFTRDTIMAMADIPKSLYTSDDVNLANAQVGARMYAEQALLPRLTTLADTLTDQLLPYYGIEPGEYWIGFDDPSPDDEAAQLERRSRMVTIGAMTINEARAEDALDPIDDPMADRLLFNGQPLGGGVGVGGLALPGPEGDGAMGGEVETDAPRANPADRDWVSGVVEQVSGGQLPGESAVRLLVMYASLSEADARALVAPAETIKAENDAAEAERAEAELAAAQVADPADDKAGVANRAEVEGKACCDEHDEPARFKALWREKDILNASPFTETPDERFIREIMDWLRRFARAAAKSPTPGLSVDSLPFGKGAKAFSDNPWIQALLEIIRRGTADPFLQGTVEGARALTGVVSSSGPAGISFDLTNPAVSRFMQQRDVTLLRAAESITETTEEIVRAVIAGGIEAGKSNQEIAADILTTMEDVSPARAITIARTESANAQVEGERAQWIQYEDETGEKLGKVWDLAHDACEICVALAARHGDVPIPLDQAFAEQGETISGGGKSMVVKIRDIQGAPAHPACRCGIQVRKLP